MNKMCYTYLQGDATITIMETVQERVFRDIVNCSKCDDHLPFHFEMGRQSVMLISFAPSYATVHRPLYYVQLYRKMCLALFGDVPPSEKFIREFYDPAGSIYWTHYQKCFKNGDTNEAAKCEPLLEKEIEALDPKLIIILGKETIKRLAQHSDQDSVYRLTSVGNVSITKRKDGTPRQIFFTEFPSNANAGKYLEIRKALKPHIDWINVECENLDFSSANFLDLEYASIEFLQESEAAPAMKISSFESEWVNTIILPNIKAYNLVLQIFIFIESNIKNVLERVPDLHDDVEKVWFSPFEALVKRNLGDGSAEAREKRQAIRSLMADIDSMHTLRNIIAHKSGVLDDRNREKKLKDISKLKRLKGVYIYGGNSIFISREGIDHMLKVCDNFREIYAENFIKKTGDGSASSR